IAITPCESWPARLALTQPTATASASSSDAPAARSSAALIRVRRSAWTIGMEISSTFERPRERRVLLVAARQHALKAAAAGQAWKYPVSHAAGTVLDGLRISSCKIRELRSAARIPAGAPAVWLTNRQ